jgi:hypothetical protein
VEFADRQRLHERGAHLRRDDVLAVWLPVIRSELGQKLVVADACRSVEARLGLDLLADPKCDVAGEGDALKVFGDVEIGLVQRQRFDDRRVLREDVADLPADGFVDLETRPHENQVRTLPLGGDGRHRRSDPKFAGLVACRSYHAAFRRAADRDRLASKIRIVPLLD